LSPSFLPPPSLPFSLSILSVADFSPLAGNPPLTRFLIGARSCLFSIMTFLLFRLLTAFIVVGLPLVSSPVSWPSLHMRT
jgi:hypothetical protein